MSLGDLRKHVLTDLSGHYFRLDGGGQAWLPLRRHTAQKYMPDSAAQYVAPARTNPTQRTKSPPICAHILAAATVFDLIIYPISNIFMTNFLLKGIFSMLTLFLMFLPKTIEYNAISDKSADT